MTGPIDEAFVEIKPDLKNFDREVRRELDSSFDKIEGKLDDLYDVIDKQFDRLIIVLDSHFGNLQHTADNTFDEIQDFARGAGRAIATDIEVGTKIAKHEIDDLADNADHDFNRIERKARGSGFSIAGMFVSIGKSIGNLISSGLESVSEIGSKIGSSLGSTIGQVGSSIGTVTSGIGGAAQIAMYGVLVPLALGLAGALSQLAGALAALPAAAGVAVTAILPLVLAFHGFSDAIGAVMAGDPEKLNEALKKLSPSAASVVKEFQKLVKPFSEIQKLAQEALFKPLVGTLTLLANAILPALRVGVPAVAAAFGKMFAQLGNLFTNAEMTGVLNKLFESTVRIINTMTPSIVHLVDVLANLFVIGLPFVERFFGVISNGINSFATWLEKAQDGDKIVGWLEKAWHVGSLAWEIIKQVAIYIGTLLGSFADEGTDTLEGIVDALKKMNDYLKTSDGQETLHNLGVIVHWAGNAFVFLLGTLTTAWKGLNAFFAFVRGIGPFFTKLGNGIKDAWNAVVNWTVSAWDSIVGWVTGAWNSIIGFFKSTGSNIGDFFKNTWNSLISDIRSFFSSAVAMLMAFPGVLKQFIVDAIHWVAYQVGFAIGTLIRFFISDLPNAAINGFNFLKNSVITSVNAIWNFITQTIPTLATNVWTWFTDMWTRANNAVQAGIETAIHWVSTLPGRTWAYVQDLQSRVNRTISDLWHSTVNFFRNLVNDVISEARRLPGQVWDAMKNVGSIAYGIGRDIVNGIVNGMKSLAGWLFDQAKDLAHRAWQGAKDALGIASPSKEFAKLGKWSAEGYVQGMDKYDISREVASQVKLPLNAFARQSQGASSSGSTSVNVGGAQIVAYLQINDEQLHPVVVTAMHENPQDVALAAQQGDTQLARRR